MVAALRVLATQADMYYIHKRFKEAEILWIDMSEVNLQCSDTINQKHNFKM